MSFDLAFWFQWPAPTVEEAAKIYDQLSDEIQGAVEEGPSIRGFYHEVTSIYPDINEDNMEESVWSSALYVTDECLIAAIAWSRSEEVSSVLIDLAVKHRLVAYDPQKQIAHAMAD
ncbi:hypothetical protein GCM10023088_10070 [Actinomadura verrucosospora]|uniref:hypothetical protein n=1 Tax=Actinomadura verrucosospora TaxID=46165 RepID=UPI0031ECC766